jgi:hypothetical protein
VLPPAELTLWLLTALVEAFAVYIFLVQGLSRKFLMLNLYFLLGAVISASRFAVFHHSGFFSVEYAYFYYYSDALLTVFLFLSVCELSLRLAGTKISRKRIVLGGAAAFLAVSVFNASAASSSSIRMMSHFVVALSQDLYFTSPLAIALLCVWKAFDDPEDLVAARFVDVIFVGTSIFILLYGARVLVPQVAVNNKLVQMMAVWLPIGCGFVAVSLEHPRTTRL